MATILESTILYPRFSNLDAYQNYPKNFVKVQLCGTQKRTKYCRCTLINAYGDTKNGKSSSKRKKKSEAWCSVPEMPSENIKI